jgi:two-component system sensor histidine kinase/response regulator
MVPSDNSERYSVLAVDDDEVHCYALQKSLQQLGWDVTCALDGLSAVDQAGTGNFDAILLDVHLPDFNGFEVLNRIRNAPIRQPAIVFHSGSAANPMGSIGPGAAQADAFLTYPVAMEHIDAVLRGAIKRRCQKK